MSFTRSSTDRRPHERGRRSGLLQKIAVLLALPLLGALLSVGYFGWYLHETRFDTHSINVAGRQRMLSATIRTWARMVASGQDEDRPGLRARIAELDSTVEALLHGGLLLGRPLAAAPEELGPDLEAFRLTWNQVKPDADSVALLPAGDERMARVFGRVDEGSERLRDAADRYVTAFEARSEAKRQRMLRLLLAFASLTGIVFLAGLWFTRRYIVNPVRDLDDAARRISGGDFARRVPVASTDELAMLATTFNAMADQVERLLATLEARSRHAERIVSSVPSGLLFADRDLCVRAVNQTFAERCHTGLEQLAGRSVSDVLGIPELEPHLRQVLASEGTRTGLLYTGSCPGSSERRPFRIAMAATHVAGETDEEGVLVAIEDLSEEERLAAHARALERRFQEVVRTASEAVILVEADGTISHFNAAAERAFGWRQAEVLGQPLTVLMPERFREAHSRALARFVAEPGASPVMNRPLTVDALRKDGTVFPAELTVSMYRVNSTIAFTGVLRDITERRRMEDELRRSEGSLRTLVDNAVFGIYRATAEGRLTVVNRRLVEMLGYETPEQLLAVDLAGAVYQDPADRARLVAAYGDSERFDGVEVDWRRRDGQLIRVRLSGRTVREGNQLEGFEVIVEDVGERHALEQQLRQAQKMEAVGQLAGGLAHDFNNLLTTIQATAELMADEAPAGTQLQADIESIREAADRGAAVTKKLLAFSRRGRLELQTFDLSQLIRDFAGLAQRLLPETITMNMTLDPATITVRADAGAIEQILMNLITNARDAMPDGGTLLIESGRSALDADFCRREGWGVPGEYATLAVSDTGSGMSHETRRRVFEPFFTTKPVGQGSGLGLAMVYGLVKQHSGYVHLDSEPRQGTTARVYFPIASGAPQPRAVPRRAGAGGTESILLVEDDPALSRATERVLRLHGYRVAVAGDGQEALARMREAIHAFDLIVTDVVMPRMGGPQLIAALRREGHSVPVLITSGYSERGAQLSGEFPTGTPFLAKPWTVAELLGAVRAALDRDA